MSGIVGVLAQPLSRAERRGRFGRAVVWKANPRAPEYMRERFAESVPSGRVVEAGPRLAAAVADADHIVLLYPDAIGLGWGPIEREVLAAAAPAAPVEVLNGRRRRFAFDQGTRRALRIRRAAEWTMFGEVLAAPVILAGAPLLWAIDALRGRH